VPTGAGAAAPGLGDPRAPGLGDPPAQGAPIGPPYDLLVISGDIFDRASPPPDAVRRLGAWLGRLRDALPHLPVVIIAGNHDNGSRLSWTASITERQGIHLRGEVGRVDEPVVVTVRDGPHAGEVAEVWAVPFLEPGSMSERNASQLTAMEEAIARIKTAWNRARVQVLVAHCFVRAGAVSDSERVLIGGATEVDPALFDGFDYVALGHLHRPQTVAPNARYAGSIVRYSFSEAGHEKSLCAVDAHAGALHRAQRHRLRSMRGMSQIEGSLEDLLKSPAHADKVDHYVKLVLNPPEYAGDPRARLVERFPWLLLLENNVSGEPGALASARSMEAAQSRDLATDFHEFGERFAEGDVSRAALAAAFAELHGELDRRSRDADEPAATAPNGGAK
jgi:exonuclease SbcD